MDRPDVELLDCDEPSMDKHRTDGIQVPEENEYPGDFFEEYGEDYLRYLFKQEDIVEWIAFPVTDARLEAVKDIIQKSKLLGLKVMATYLALVYFARIISKKIYVEKTLAMSCLYVAAKMEERKQPDLSDYEDDDMPKGSILDVETVILTSEWRNLAKITPFQYLVIFYKALKQSTGIVEFVINAEDLIMRIVEDVALDGKRPSDIAFAATVLIIHGHNLEREFVDAVVDEAKLQRSLIKESVYFCYKLMETKRKLRVV